jgi:hypothetical protein
MFRTKVINYIVMIAPKPPKTNNVKVNVVVAITTRSQQPEQHMFKEREPIKAKGIKDWQQ